MAGPDPNDPFATFDPFNAKQKANGSTALSVSPPAAEKDPFANFDPFKGAIDETKTSTAGTALRGLVGGALPGLGSLPAAAAGAEVGTVLGLPGAIVGGLAGAYFGAEGIASAQNWALNKVPKIRDMLGQSEEQKRLDQEEHPIASFLGGIAPFAVTMSPGGIAKKLLPENATTWQKLAANPLTSRLFSGSIMGGMQLGQEAVSEDKVNWNRVAIATGFGLIWNKPNRIGEAISEYGARPARFIMGRPQPSAPAPAERPPTQAETSEQGVAGPGVTEATYTGSEQRNPEAEMAAIHSAGVEDSIIGPVRSPDLENRARQSNPEVFNEYDSLLARQRGLRNAINEYNEPKPYQFLELAEEREALERELAEHAAARNGYDRGPRARQLKAQIRHIQAEEKALTERGEAFRAGTAAETPELASARKQLMDTEFALRDVLPRVQAAYRSAAEYTETPTVAPPVEEVAAPPTEGQATAPLTRTAEPQGAAVAATPEIEQQRAFIAKDVADKMIAAGRPAEEAELTGHLVAARYIARAQRFRGALGSATDLYKMEGPRIIGGRVVTRPPETPPGAPPPALPTTKEELRAYIAAGGEISAAPKGGAIPPMREAAAIGRAPEPVELVEPPAPPREPSAAERGVPFYELRGDGVLIDEGTREPVPGAPTFQNGNQVQDWLTKSGKEYAGIKALSWAKAAGAKEEEPLPPIKEVKVRAPRGPAAKDPSKYSLLEFLAKNGGLKPEPDTLAIFSGRRHFVPGFGPLLRNAGKSIDKALEAAIEAGYLPREAEGQDKWRPEDLRKLIEAEARGTKQYKLGEAPPAAKIDKDEQRHQIESAADGALEADGIDPKTITGELRDRMLEIMEREGVRDPSVALEQAAMELEHRGSETGATESKPENIPGWDVEFPNEPRAAPGAGEGAQARGEQAPVSEASGGPREPGGGYREPAAEEPGVEGKPQFVLPGAERIGEGEYAQRLANQPLRADVQQKEAGGLFGEDHLQKDFFQGLDHVTDEDIREFFQTGRAPPFYSAVERAVQNLGPQRASPEQWLATIKRATGVKPEEMEWLGLEKWLKEQKGPVTKEAITDYIRANQIQIKEVEKGTYYSQEIPTVEHPDPWVRANLDNNNFVNDWIRDHRHLDQYARLEGETRDQQTARLETIAQEKLAEASSPQYFGRQRIEATETPPKYETYTLPGGENYRELLLTLPPKETGLPAGTSIIKHRNGDYYYLADESGAPFHGRVGRYENQEINGHTPEEVMEKVQNNPQGSFRSSHFDEPNILAHVRFDDRVIDGKKTLFLEEAQSDWHQAGRRKGYDKPFEDAKPEDLTDARKVNEGVPGLLGDNHPPKWEFIDRRNSQLEYGWGETEEIARRHALLTVNSDMRRAVAKGAVPNAPFKTTWPELILKRMIRYAAENGYEKVAWTIGETQNKRYDLSKQIKELHVGRTDDGDGSTIYHLNAVTNEGRRVGLPLTKEADLPDVIGKEMADRVIKDGGGRLTAKIYTGLDLKIGGEGMKGFYDKILPAAANKLVKKFGAKTDTSQIDVSKGKPTDFADYDDWAKAVSERRTEAVHTLDITPQLRDAAVEGGFPLFQGAKGAVRFTEGKKPIITLLQDADASTVIHELGHTWLEELGRDSQHPAAPETIRQDMKTVLDWLGLKNTLELGAVTKSGAPTAKARKAHERFATGFEQYMREGRAPSPELATVFARFKAWLMDLYKTITGLGKEISPEVRAVFDRMLTQEAGETVIGPKREGGPTLTEIHEADAKHTEPHEGEQARERVIAERDRYEEEQPQEIKAELEGAAKAIQPEAGPGAEPAGQGAAGPGGRGEVVGGGGEPEPKPPSGGGGEEPGAIVKGGTNARPESATIPGAGAEPGSATERGHPLAPSSAPDSIPRGEGRLVDKAGNIRVENVTNQADVGEALHESADRNTDFEPVRGAPMGKGLMWDLATDLGVDPNTFDHDHLYAHLEKLTGGMKDMAQKVLAARRLLKQSAANVAELMKRVAKTDSDEDAKELALAITRHDMIQSAVSGATASWGRTGSAFHDISTGWDQVKDINALLMAKTGRTLFQLKQIAKLGAEFDRTGQISQFVRDSGKRNFGRMITEYWINGLISGIQTHMTYAIGNTILGIEKMGPETALAAGIGAVRRALGREGDTVRLGELAAGLRGLKEGYFPAVQAGLEGARSGVTTLLPGEDVSQTLRFQPPVLAGGGITKPAVLNEAATFQDVMATAFGIVRGIREGVVAGAALQRAGGLPGAPLYGWEYTPGGAIPNFQIRGATVLPIGGLVRAPSRMIASIHSFFRSMNYSVEIHQRAYRDAANQNLTGAAFDSHVASFVRSPPEEAMKAGHDVSTELTLMGQGGEITRKLSALVNTEFFGVRDERGRTQPGSGIQLLKFIDPFIHISSNIIRKSIVERTPVGLLSPSIRAELMSPDNVRADTAAARMLAGTALSILFGSLAAEGYVTGSEPKDRQEAAIWRQVYQAHSIKIGDTWYAMNRLGPMGMLLSTAADLYDVAHHTDRGEYAKAAAAFQHAVTQNILDESFMRGPSDLLKAISDPPRYGEAYIKNFVASFIPFSVAMGQMARATDPYTRDARTVTDAIKNKVPGLSQSLMPRRDVWGEILPSRESLGPPGLLAVWEQKTNDDPVNKALLNLGLHPGAVGRKIRNVELTPEEHDDWARLAGRLAKVRMDAIVRSPSFQSMPNPIKHDLIIEQLRQSREVAQNMMFMKYPHLMVDAQAVKMRKKMGPEP